MGAAADAASVEQGTARPGRPPRRWRRVDGMLLLDKPVGLSSNAALQRARRLLQAEKAGHTGTLDPLASGLLPLCFGEATKFSQALLDAPKRYRATIRFGAATTTGDSEGDVVQTAPVAFDAAAIATALERFVGRIVQLPPRYAALKRDGRPYYEYARAGIDIEREPRKVEIAALALVEWTPPDAIIDVTCSKGTYVRVLAEDVGAALGSCAHLAGLRRTGTAGFDVADAVTLERLEALDPSERAGRLLPVDAALAQMPVLVLDAEAAGALVQGRQPASTVAAGRYRAYGPAGLLGLVDAEGACLRPVRLVRTDGHD